MPACAAAQLYPKQSRNARLPVGFTSQDFKAGFRSLGPWQFLTSSVATYCFYNIFSVVQCLLVVFSFFKKNVVFNMSPKFQMENKPEVANVF